MSFIHSNAGAALSAAILTASLAAQCDPRWQPGAPLQGIRGVVNASAIWDPDGAGPLGPRVVLAGEFSQAGPHATRNIAAYDPATGAWSAFGAGLDRPVRALAVLVTGELVVGGLASTTALSPGLARWDGAAWQALGNPDDSVFALLVRPNGDLVAGGQFRSVSGVAAAKVAMFNGTQWSAAGPGLGAGSGAIYALTTATNGDLVAAGLLPMASPEMRNVVRFDGTAWSSLGAGPTNMSTAYALARLANGNLVVSGGEPALPPASRLARWDGTAWSTLARADGGIAALATAPNGDLIVGGQFTNLASFQMSSIGRFDGTTWHRFGNGIDDSVYALALGASGEVFAAGRFERADQVSAESVARWNGTGFAPLGLGNAGSAESVLAVGPGDFVVAGGVSSLGGVAVPGIARGDGRTWAPLGAGPGFRPRSVTVRPTGELVACGYAQQTNGSSVGYVAQWNGATWTSIGTAVGGVAQAATLTNGDVVVGGWFTSIDNVAAPGLAVWRSGVWSPLGNFLGTDGVVRLRALPGGNLLVGSVRRRGSPATPSNVARWDGNTWTYLGTGSSTPFGETTVIRALARLGNGDIVVGGQFESIGGVAASRVARWDGTAWQPMGAGLGTASTDSVAALDVLPNGDVVAAGSFARSGTVQVNHLARWDGRAWRPFAGGVALDARVGEAVLALAAESNGDLWLGGTFRGGAGGVVSPNLARLQATCPATVTRLGAGCPSSGGGNALTATQAWTGTVWTARGSGLPLSGAALSCLGFSTVAVPLRALIAQGQVGCTLFALPEYIALLPVVAGGATVNVAVPADVRLAGARFHHQLVPIEFTAAGGLRAVTATDALTLTIGGY